MKRLGFGLMRLPLVDAGDVTAIDHERVNDMVDEFVAKGFTYFDTAYVYHQGLSEKEVKTALVDRHPRESFRLATKMPTFSVSCPEDYDKFFAEQLERTGAGYFDYYLLHNLGAVNYASTLKHGGFEYVKKLKAEGKVRHIGFSFHDKAELLDEILTKHPEMEFVQLQINYVDWDDLNVDSRRCYEIACKHNKPIIIMEPIKGGSLASVPAAAEKLLKEHNPSASPASWAVRYCMSLDNVFMILSGMSSREQLEENCAVADENKALTKEEREVLERVAKIVEGMAAIPCTECRYCVDDCPQKIAIPDYISLYNDQHMYGFRAFHDVYYRNTAKEKGKASDCIKCGACESHCPQRIEIMNELEKIADVFEKELVR